MNFKDQLERDLKRSFNNSKEFAQTTVFYYKNNRYKIPVVLDYDGNRERNKPSGDHAEGLFLCDLRMFIALSDLKTVPRKGEKIEMDDNIYTIEKVENEFGELVLYLEMIDE